MQRYGRPNIWSEIVKYEFLVIDYPLGQKSGRAQGANFLTGGPNSILTPDSSSPWSKTYISVWGSSRWDLSFRRYDCGKITFRSFWYEWVMQYINWCVSSRAFKRAQYHHNRIYGPGDITIWILSLTPFWHSKLGPHLPQVDLGQYIWYWTCTA